MAEVHRTNAGEEHHRQDGEVVHVRAREHGNGRGDHPDRPVGGQAGGATVPVITCGAPCPEETAVSRNDIQLGRSAQVTASALSSWSGHRVLEPHAGDGDEPDIIVDYLDPDGPTICHTAATQTALRGRSGLIFRGG
jgi:hypothetical protein